MLSVVYTFDAVRFFQTTDTVRSFQTTNAVRSFQTTDAAITSISNNHFSS